MRWDELFADLEGQLAEAEAAELGSEIADRTRREAAGLSLVGRLQGSVGAPVAVRVPGAGVVDGTLVEVGAEWLLLLEGAAREVLVPLAAVLSVSGLTRHSAPAGSGGRVFERLGLGSALRGIARDRSTVTLWLSDGSTLTGVLDRVGADFVELSAGAHDGWRSGEPVLVRTVPTAAVVMVRRQP